MSDTSSESASTSTSTSEDGSRRPYTESSVIMTTVRVLAPFVITYGLFVMFHGADSSGGGFQGGAIVASMVILIGFAYGIFPTMKWFTNTAVVVLATGGALGFVAIGLGAIVSGGSFLEYAAYPIGHSSKYGIEAVELGIGGVVAGVISGLFFAVARGFTENDNGNSRTDTEAEK
ncbi:MnhB domain-containing protein [Halorutilales archaeon Cl-col2-1]